MIAFRSSRWPLVGLALVSLLAAARPIERTRAPAPIDPRLYSGLTWRNIGPFRAGRIAAVTGVIGQPGVFYAGLPAAGVWKTTSAGETWYPVFDAIKDVSSIGAIEVAPSDPDVVYAGSGDIVTGGAINEGNGVYRSGDAGRTWRHVGLDASKQIPSMLVDLRDPNIVLAAAQGDLHAKSETRGVYRTTDGGASWTRTLFADDSTGVQKLARANDMPAVIFATTVSHYIAPPSTAALVPTPPAAADAGPTNTALYKSLDGGVTWRMISGGGLPRLAGRTSVAVAMGTNAQRVFLIGNTGLYRSDDGGTSWRQMAADDQRIRNGQGGYNCGVYVDPQHPDVVYTIGTSSYRSMDGGQTFTGFKGAPGGDDPQQLWIDPTNGQRMLLGLDQGATVTLDGGATWSSWYNQSTEQIYHLSIDNSTPYWVYGTQQDAGAIRTRARGNLGAITPLDWSPVPGWEWGTIVADPLDPSIVYGSGAGILKISYPSEQWINVSPATDPAAKLRTTSSQPIAFAPWNRRMLIAAFQSVWSTTDGGAHWTAMSPDLTLAPGATAPPAGARPGAIESLAASTIGSGMIWVGTNNGLVKLTRNGGRSWDDVSIPGLPSAGRAEVLSIEPSHQDAATAYAVVSLSRVGDYAPYVFRTHDFGHTWTKIVNGLAINQPSGSFARVVRSDSVKAGLLFAGTESGMYVSFDDGEQWQSLSQNLPTTSYRDIAIKGNDLVVATYGRGLWVLDDYSMLRQLTPATASEPAFLFRPGDVVRNRRNVGADTPFPPEVPHALNPRVGVTIDYWLAQAPSREITLDVLDASGAVVRHLTSTAAAPVAEAARPPHPNFWVENPHALPAQAGTNRTSWDLRYDAPPAFRHSYEINANPGLTPPSPEGALALPGQYTLRLTVDGRRYTQPVVVHADPRSPASLAALRAQHTLLMNITNGIRESYAGHDAVIALRSALTGVVPANSSADLADISARAATFAAQLDTVAGLDAGRARARPGQPTRPSFTAINGAFVSQLNAQDAGDMAPTAATLAAYAATCRELAVVVASWERFTSRDFIDFNTMLQTRGRAALPRPSAVLRAPSCP
jgi:photosystem II stability/assembly factor-like uncharacterized protein